MAVEKSVVAGAWIDCTISDEYTLEAEVTDSPVESGENVADHVRVLPDEFALKGVVSNHPIEVPKSHMGEAEWDRTVLEIEGEPALLALPIVGELRQVTALANIVGAPMPGKRRFAVNSLHFTAPFDRVSAVEEAITAALRAGEPVEVITATRSFPRVLLQHYSATRDKDTGDALHFSIRARAVRIVDSETDVAVPDPVHERSKPAQSGGKAQAQDVPQAEVPQSLLRKLLGS